MQRKRHRFHEKSRLQSEETSRKYLEHLSISKSINITTHGNSDDLLPLPALSYIYSSVLIGVCSLICFWRSVYGEFVFDDSKAVVDNRDVSGNVSVIDIFYHDFWGNNILSNVSHKSYRPLTTLTFKLNYYVVGGVHPWGFHFINILLHTIVSILFLFIFDTIFGVSSCCSHNDNDNSYKLDCPKASLLSALFFTVHPVHTESVCGVVGRAELLSALMFSFAFLLYVQSCKQESFLKMLFFLAISMISTAVAMLFKEQGITVLGICCVYDSMLLFCLVRPRKPSNVSSQTNCDYKTSVELVTIKPFISRQLVMGVSGIVMIVCRFLVMGRTAPKFKSIDNPASFAESAILRAVNYNYIYSMNIWLLIFPWWLCFDWSMGCIPLIKTLNDFRIFAPIVMWSALVYLSWCAFYSPKRSIFLIGLALWVVPFLPASNLFFQVGFVVAERVLYLSVGGYCVLFVLGLNVISKNINKKVSFILTYSYFVFLIWRTIYRSEEWKNEESLFVSGLKVCPLNAKVHYNIGKLKADGNNVAEALKYYREAIRLNPQYDQAYNNLGNLLQGIGDISGAEKALETALSIRPSFAASWMNLGITKASLRKYQEAEQCYLKAIQYRRNYADAHYNLGNLYIDWDKPQDAAQHFEVAIQLNPLKENAWNNLIILMDNTGKLENAAIVSVEALKLFPGSASLHFSFGNILGKMKKFEESERHFLQAIDVDNSNSNYYGNLGVLYHKWGKMSEAKKFYTKALELNTDNQMVKQNLRKLQRKMGKS